MELLQTVFEIGRTLPAAFATQKDGSLKLEFVVAERKAFLSKKKLTYSCRIRIDDTVKQVRFFEMIKESGFGVSGGGDDMETGFGFKKETYSISGKKLTATIEEQSKLFGKDYSYTFEFGKIRELVRQAAEAAGYTFDITLREKNV